MMLSGLLFLAACVDTSTEQVTHLPNVEIASATLQSQHTRRHFIGQVVAEEDVRLFAQVSGFLKARHFLEGEHVAAGELLFEIDDGPFVAAVLASEAELAAAKATLNISELNLSRAKPLLKTGAISIYDIDQLKNKEEEAQAKLKFSEAGLEQSRLQLSFTRIYAPFDGIISDARVALGELIKSGETQLANLVSQQPMHVNFQISDKERHQLQAYSALEMQQQVYLTLADGQEYPLPGTVSYIDNRIDTASATLAIQASFDNPKKSLLAGQHVDVILRDAKPKSVLTVPRLAIQKDLKGSYLMMLDADDTVYRRNVMLGDMLADKVIIVQGLKMQQRFITQGLQGLSSGQKVQFEKTAVADNDTKTEKEIEPKTAMLSFTGDSNDE